MALESRGMGGCWMVFSSEVMGSGWSFRKIHQDELRSLICLCWFERPLPLYPGGLGTWAGFYSLDRQHRAQAYVSASSGIDQNWNQVWRALWSHCSQQFLSSYFGQSPVQVLAISDDWLCSQGDTYKYLEDVSFQTLFSRKGTCITTWLRPHRCLGLE